MLKKFLSIYLFIFLPFNVSYLNAANPNSNGHNAIKKIKVTKNGSIRLKFCKPISELEGFIKVGDKKYTLEQANIIKGKKIKWDSEEKNIFNEGNLVKIDTNSLYGIPKNSSESDKLILGCKKALPPIVKVSSSTNPLIFILGAGLIGIAAGSGGSSSSSSSSSSN